jgi:light-regulated signal transduction histidine kinase (bacteriophytochrome)
LLQLNIATLIDQEQLKNDPIRFDLLTKGIPMMRERRMKHKDGSIIEVEANVKLCPDATLLAIARDITERVEARRVVNALNESLETKVIERTVELQEANQELQAFNYSVSHDLQSPLRVVNGFVKILLKDHAAKLDGDGRQLLETIGDNVVRMSKLISDLLEFSKSGKTVIAKEPVDMNRIVNAIIDEVKTGHENFTTQIIVHPLSASYSDANLIKQVWANLILNAVKFSGKKERPVIEIGNQVSNGGVIYFVKDNGAGFDMENAAKLFTAFERMHHFNDFEGTGVGLATTHRIITRHGGKIWAEATPNEGATFYFTTPG